MHHLVDKLAKYKDFINIITVILLLILPITTGKLTLFFFMILFLNLYLFKIYLSSDFSTLWVYGLQAIVSLGYILMSILIILHSLYIIKRRLSNKANSCFSVCMSVVGLYSLYLTIKEPSIFTGSLVVLFLIFLTFRWILHFKKTGACQ
jgi:hypothetical protein